MFIDISSLKKTTGDSCSVKFNEDLSSKAAEYGVDILNPVKVTADVTNCGSYFQVSGSIDVAVKLICDRCLKSYEYLMDIKLFEQYYYIEDNDCKRDLLVYKTDIKPDVDLGEKIPFSGDLINIDLEVLSAVRLALPMKCLCSKDCLGLCPKCGMNLNFGQCNCQNDDIDVRMSVLKKLL